MKSSSINQRMQKAKQARKCQALMLTKIAAMGGCMLNVDALQLYGADGVEQAIADGVIVSVRVTRKATDTKPAISADAVCLPSWDRSRPSWLD